MRGWRHCMPLPSFVFGEAATSELRRECACCEHQYTLPISARGQNQPWGSISVTLRVWVPSEYGKDEGTNDRKEAENHKNKRMLMRWGHHSCPHLAECTTCSLNCVCCFLCFGFLTLAPTHCAKEWNAVQQMRASYFWTLLLHRISKEV